VHVLLLGRAFPHHHAGGLEWHSQDVMEGLMAAGHRVSVMTTALPSAPILRALKPDGALLCLGNSPGRYSAGFALDFMRRAAGFVRAQRPDVIHAQGYMGLLADQFLPREAPLFTTIHGTLWSETPLRGSGPHGFAAHWRFKHRHAAAPLWRRFLRRAKNLIVDSEFTREELLREMPGLGGLSDRIRTVPLGFDLARYPMGNREEARRKFGIDQGDFFAVALGRLEAIKGAHILVEAAHQLPGELRRRVRFFIAGDGPERAGLTARNQLGQAMRFPGRVTAEDVPALLQAADIFLNADLGAPAFGLANAEALVMGARVLTTRRGAHPEVVRDVQDGVLLSGEVGDWRDAIAAAVAEDAREGADARDLRAQRARMRFARETMVAQLVACWAESL